MTASADRSAVEIETNRASDDDRLDLDEVLGLPLSDAALWEMALTHRSFAFEQGVAVTNERLEFLGDAVLQLAISEHLYQLFPDIAEGRLTKVRAIR